MLLFLGEKKPVFFEYLINEGFKFHNLKSNINKKSKKFLNKFSIIISFNYKYRIEKKILDNFKNKCFNCHISYLPWNQGADPNFWSFKENTKKGITIHLMREKIDKGPILFQKRLFFNKNKETLKTSYSGLNNELEKLLIKKYEKLLKKDFKIKNFSNGTFHKKKDFIIIKNIIKNIYDIKISKLLDIIKYNKI